MYREPSTPPPSTPPPWWQALGRDGRALMRLATATTLFSVVTDSIALSRALSTGVGAGLAIILVTDVIATALLVTVTLRSYYAYTYNRGSTFPKQLDHVLLALLLFFHLFHVLILALTLGFTNRN